MAESYSTSLKITLIGDGDLSGSWGDTTNTNWNLMEQAVTGVDTLSSMGDANYTLSNLNGTSDEARNQVIVVPSTTTLSTARYIYAPYVQKTYIIVNNSNETIKQLDARGAFEADDEVGFIFNSIKDISSDLTKTIERLYDND